MAKYFTLSILIGMFLGFAYLQQQPLFYPLPTEIANEQREGEENQSARLAYIEKLHRTAPGVDWRAIEMENRLENNHLRAQALMSRTTANDTIAGDLIGEWHEKGGANQAGRVVFMDIDPNKNRLYAAADGGSIWSGKMNGTDWKPLNNLFQLENIKHLRVLPNGNVNRIIVAGENSKIHSFFYSDDEGITWNTPFGAEYDTIVMKGSILDCAVANNTHHSIYLLASDNTEYALYKSDNLGTNFIEIAHLDYTTFGSSDRMDLWTDEDGSGTLYLLAKNKCYKLVGNTLVLQGNNVAGATSDASLTGAEIGGQTYLYACYKNATGGTNYFVSSDAGVTWSTKGFLSKEKFMKNSFGCSSITPGVLYMGEVDIWKSTDFGQNWTKMNHWGDYYGNVTSKPHADLPCIRSYALSPTSENTYFCTDGGIFESSNKALSFNNLTLSGLHNAQYYDVLTLPKHNHYILAGAQDQGFQRTTTGNAPGPQNFTQLISGDYGYITTGDGGDSYWAEYPGFVMYYSNYNNNNYTKSWDFDNNNFNNHLWIPPVMADPTDPKSVFVAGGSTTGSGTRIIKLTYNNNNTLTHTESAHNFNTQITALAYSPVIPSMRFAYTDAREFFFSSDAGANWANFGGNNLPDGHYFYGNAILTSPLQASTIYLGGSGYSGPAVYLSTNYGASFTPMSTGLPPTLVFDLACTPDEKYIFAATEAGPYVFITAQQTWFYLGGVTAPDETYWSVEYIPSLHTARFGTYGRGIWDFELAPEMYTSISNAPVATFAVFPNPSNGVFTLNADKNLPLPANINIYTLSGQLLFQDRLTAATQEVNWENATNGMYLVEIVSKHNRRFTQKVQIVGK